MTEKEFKDIFDQYYDMIRNFLFYKVKEMVVAEDLAQEVFMTLWQGDKEIVLSTLKSYLFTMANNKAINHFKKQKTILNFAQHFKRSTSDYETPEFLAQVTEFSDHLKNAISSLPEKSRTVFLMNRIDGMKYKEIATALDISIKAVEKRMSKALQHLRQKVFVKI